MIGPQFDRSRLRNVSERSEILAWFERALAAVSPDRLIRDAVRVLPEGILVRGRPLPAGIRRIRCLSIGKAATPMARALEQTLGPHLADGIALAPHGFGGSTSTVRVLQGGHPFPDADGLDSARQIAAFADGTQDRDLVFVLLSGGGSALLAAPPPTVSLSDLAETNRLLHACGAPIDAVNTVRRHLSTLAGGQLQRRLAPATTITLILSDVVGDRLETIASGPTVPDPTSFDDARAVLGRYHLWKSVPDAVRAHLTDGLSGSVSETVKPGDPAFAASTAHVLATNRTAWEAVADAACLAGWNTVRCEEPIVGEAATVGHAMAKQALTVQGTISRPTLLVGGGETTVTLHGDGLGGRNQELALAAALVLDGSTGIDLATLATDGVDGPTNAAGAIVDGTSAACSRAAGIDPLEALSRNDSHAVHHAAGDLLLSGPTRTNVADVLAVRIRPPSSDYGSTSP